MSEPKLVSPLLDHFVMGQPISEHHGVRCYPAMQKDSDSKYIVKIVSIPASQRSLDALLLAGAFSSPAAAQDYFRELAEGVVKEAEILQHLSKLEGFLPYNGWQIEPMETDTGYNVYLLSDYRRSLDRHFRRETMTHLAAVNLGLDLCAALAVCRRCGYLYTNLRPGNVFVGEDQSYRIGDLGFAALDSLQHASLPDRYRSAYTPPEIADAYCCLNTTVDIYAAGLILYQAYNNGQLPFEETAPADPLPPPMYADPEMAEIILKACDPNPENRWDDPLKMGKALVSYMQRNSVNDVPIVPVPPVQEVAAAEEAVIDDLPDDDYLAEDVQASLELNNLQKQENEPEETPEPEEIAKVEEVPEPEEAPELEEAPE
ncbi:MAG: protein kinase, partial [Oscillospiraceae bacterium]|nr:protein kinase [Oscillospiraceae bacterium]